MTTPGRMPASEKCTSLEEGSMELLPGILDEVTLYQIVPKLPWDVFYILSSVSRAWLNGIRTRRVYDARVSSHSTETLGLVNSDPAGNCTLCSMKEEPVLPKRKDLRISAACRKLPPIPYHGGKWLCTDGYVYLLAGVKNSSPGIKVSGKVFVFDVAGQGQWKECASMNEPRRDFGCGAIHGKLYVFGGLSTDARRHASVYVKHFTFCGSEVYDPKEDRWSPIRPMTTLRYDHKVETVGNELVVHGGLFFDRDHFNAMKMKDDDHSSYDEAHARVANILEVYDPLKDEWRVQNPFVPNDESRVVNPGRGSKNYLFATGAKLYSIDSSSIHVYAGDNSWSHLHSFSFPTGPVDSSVGKIYSAIVVDGELLVQASWRVNINPVFLTFRGLQSKGFGGESENIMWRKASQFQMRYGHYPTKLIQL